MCLFIDFENYLSFIVKSFLRTLYHIYINRGMSGHKLNQGGICPPPFFKYAFGEIQNSMFLPLMKKALLGGIEGRRQN